MDMDYENETLDYSFDRDCVARSESRHYLVKNEAAFILIRRFPMLRIIRKTFMIIRAYLSDKEQSYSRIIHFARLSILINITIGIGKMVIGFYNQSFLFFVSGFYNIGLSFSKMMAVKGYCESKGKQIWPFNRQDNNFPGKWSKKEYHYYHHVGLIVLLASIAYTIGSIGVLTGSHCSAYYSTIMIVLIGFVTAIEIVASLQGIFAWRRKKEPILEAIKLTNLVSSLIGLVLVQTAILGHLGRKPIIYFDYVGVFLGAVSLCIGIYMIIYARLKMIKKSK